MTNEAQVDPGKNLITKIADEEARKLDLAVDLRWDKETSSHQGHHLTVSSVRNEDNSIAITFSEREFEQCRASRELRHRLRDRLRQHLRALSRWNREAMI